MWMESAAWTPSRNWQRSAGQLTQADLVLYFGDRAALADPRRHAELRDMHPQAMLLGCSTGGQILGDDVSDDTIAAVALKFAATPLRLAVHDITDTTASHACGRALGERLAAPHDSGEALSAVFVLSDGLQVNGTALVAGLCSAVGRHVRVSGGMAGDGALFQQTLVGANCAPCGGRVAALGLYGRAVQVASGSAGGWDVFGVRRRITNASGSTLFELDGEPALDLYERYLGPEEAGALPGSALFYPLKICDPDRPEHDIVRTVLTVDRERRSMTFAGDMPSGWVAQLMRGTHHRLVAGAREAGRQASAEIAPVPGRAAPSASGNDRLAILISCIGRRLLMGQRVADEIEAAALGLGAGTQRIGFYSYGEMAPHAQSGFCELHNQTMTITTLSELH